jgi:hypothetical protein
MSNIDQTIPTQPSSIDENNPNPKNETVENTEASLENNLKSTEKKISLQSPFPVLSKYKDIYIPSIYTLNLKEINDAPWRKSDANLSDYFNYNYTEENWIEHTEEIKSKFDELNTMVKEKEIGLPSIKNELDYLLKFPSDYGGLDEVFKEQNFENVKFFDNKINVNNLAPLVRYNQQVYVNLEMGNQNINNNINITNINPFNPSSSITNTNLLVNNRNFNFNNIPLLNSLPWNPFLAPTNLK